jgi:hypothetical protein
MYRIKVHVITDYKEDRFEEFLQKFIESLERNFDVNSSSIKFKYHTSMSPAIDSEYVMWYSALITWKQWEGKGETL